jgi:Putative cyclase/TAT (twin-arginine translocation) pathway signal sequence
MGDLHMQSGWLQQSRRDFLRGAMAAGVAAGMTGTASAAHAAIDDAAQAQPQAQETPLGPPWWPSRWGPEDEAGASNWITPEKVLEAARLIRTGKIYELGRMYESAMPLFGARVFELRVPGTPSGGPVGNNRLVYHDEFVASELGQVGTQFDGLGHIGVQIAQAPMDHSQTRFYNGFTEAEVATPYGLTKLGVEKVKPFFTRAILVDVAGFKGGMLDLGVEISLADVRGALGRERIDENSIRPGDAVFFNSGWGSLWMRDNTRFNAGEPGIGLEVARWLVDKQVSLVGSDTWATEVVPNPNPDLVFIVHNELLTKNGIFNHENLDFSGLIADQVYEFVYNFAPLRIKGATGSPGRPLALT